MEEVMACRACLATDIKLFNMYKFGLNNAYEILTGMQISPADGLPHQMCSFCAALLKKCAVFQQKCNNAQQLLQLAVMQEQMVTTEYIRSIDRKVHNLTHTYTIRLNQTQYEDIKQELDLDIEPIQELSSFINVIKDEQDYEEFGGEFGEETKVEDDSSSDEEPLSIMVKKRKKKEKKRKDENIKDEIDAYLLFDDKDGEKDALNDYMVEVITLTREEQIQEIESRKESANYKNSLYKCDQCYKGFMLKNTFENHMDRHDPTRGEVSCEICHVRWPDKQKLQAHVLSTHRKKYICRKCGHVSRSSHSAKEHFRWHQGVTYICDICGASFNKSTSHLTHVRLQHPSNHICDICGASFVSLNGLKIHRNKAHKYEKETGVKENGKCVLCKVQFKNAEALHRHVSCQNGICNPNLSPCLTCGSYFLNKETLKEHEKQHMKDESMTCSQCDRKFANARSHAIHYQRVHLGVKMKARPRTNAEADFVCDVCGKMCSSKATLVYHQRTHSGEKPYPCTECPKRFGVYQRLQIHMRTHTGERPFKCAQCPKAFKHKAALNRHVRVHTGVKPYSCPNCGKAFSQSNTLKLHVRTVHLKLAAPYRRQKPKDCLE